MLSVEESFAHPHARERAMFVHLNRVPHPAPAPRFSRTPGAIQGPAAKPGEGGLEALGRGIGRRRLLPARKSAIG